MKFHIHPRARVCVCTLLGLEKCSICREMEVVQALKSTMTPVRTIGLRCTEGETLLHLFSNLS